MKHYLIIFAVLLIAGCGSSSSKATTPIDASMAPAQKVETSAKNVTGDRFVSTQLLGDQAIIVFRMDVKGLSTDEIRQFNDSTMINTARQIYADEPSVNMILFQPTASVTDTYGNTKDDQAMAVKLSRATMDKIGPDLAIANFPTVADGYEELVKF